MTDEEYDAKIEELEAALRPQLTDEFLATLVECARIDFGTDAPATYSFLEEIFRVAGKPMPDYDLYSHTILK